MLTCGHSNGTYSLKRFEDRHFLQMLSSQHHFANGIVIRAFIVGSWIYIDFSIVCYLHSMYCALCTLSTVHKLRAIHWSYLPWHKTKRDCIRSNIAISCLSCLANRLHSSVIDHRLSNTIAYCIFIKHFINPIRIWYNLLNTSGNRGNEPGILQKAYAFEEFQNVKTDSVYSIYFWIYILLYTFI